MDCRYVRDQLVWHIIGELDEADRDAVEKHLAECTACRWECERLRLMLGESRAQAPKDVAGPDLREALDVRIRAEIAQARRQERRLRGLRWVAGVAASLVALLGLGAWIWGHRTHEPSGADRVAELHEIWRHEGISSVHTTTEDAPAVCGDSVYGMEINAEGRHVVCLEAKTGRPRWESGIAAAGYLAADASRVYAVGGGPNRGCRLLALDAQSGELVWSYEPGKSPVHGTVSKPLLLGDRLCWGHGPQVVLLDAATGERIWTQTFPQEGVMSPPVAQGDRVWVATAKALHVLDVVDGRIARSKALSDRAARLSPPLLAVSGNRCYIAMRSSPRDSRLLCYDHERDHLVWETAVGNMLHLQVFGEIVIARSDSVRAWDGASGRLLWTHSAQGCGPVSPIGDKVCFVDVRGPGALVTLEAHTGRLVSRYAGKRSCAGLVVGKEIGYLNAQDGVLYAVAIEKA